MVHRRHRRAADTVQAAPNDHLANGPPGSRPPDDEFIGGAFDEAALVTLDFDDATASRDLHDREPDDDFDPFASGEARSDGPLDIDAFADGLDDIDFDPPPLDDVD